MGYFRQSMGQAVPVAGLVLSLGVALPFAQHPPLSEVARKESERRKDQKPSVKVYTNKDLPAPPKGRPSVPPQADTTAAAAAAAPSSEQKPDAEAAPGEKPTPDDKQKSEAWWKERIASAREELRRNEMFAEALQSRINSLSRDFVNRDNPAQRRELGEERAEALTELSRVKAEVERGKKQIEDLHEEARQAGVPAGWLH